MGAGVLVGAGVPSRFEVTAESGPSDPAAAARLLTRPAPGTWPVPVAGAAAPGAPAFAAIRSRALASSVRPRWASARAVQSAEDSCAGSASLRKASCQAGSPALAPGGSTASCSSSLGAWSTWSASAAPRQTRPTEPATRPNSSWHTAVSRRRLAACSRASASADVSRASAALSCSTRPSAWEPLCRIDASMRCTHSALSVRNWRSFSCSCAPLMCPPAKAFRSAFMRFGNDLYWSTRSASAQRSSTQVRNCRHLSSAHSTSPCCDDMWVEMQVGRHERGKSLSTSWLPSA